ncbi:oligosaccharide flippase family protein [Bacillus thuringiensis]
MKIMSIIIKYKSAPAPIKASFWFLISSVLTAGIRFFVTPIYTRIMSETDYGTIGLFNAWQAALTVVVTLSLSAGVFSNGLLDFKEDKAKFSSSILVLSSISAGVWYVIFLAFKDSILNVINLSNLQMTVMFIGFLVNPALGYWAAEQKFDYKYKQLTVITVLAAMVSQIIAIIAAMQISGDKATIVIVTSGFINIFVNSIIYVYILFRGNFSVNLKYWKYVLAFNLPLIPHYLSFFVLSQSDRIMIANIAGIDKAGIYTLGYTAASILQIIYAAINASLSPFTLKKMKEQKYTEIGNVANYILVIYGIVSVMFISFAPEIIKILAPPSYYEAAWIIPPVTIGLYFFVVTGFFTNIEFYHKKTVFIMLCTVGAAVLNLLLNYFFIPAFGFIAAAYTTAIGYLIFMILHYLFMKKIESNSIYDVNFFIRASTVFIVVSIFLMMLYNFFIIRLAIVCIIFVVLFLKRKLIEQKVREMWILK